VIVFNKLRFKNFLSSGDNFVELELSKSNSTLIVGQNGAGKSTMLDALSFALFGKAHRNVNKPQLINSINNKNCLVEVEFTVFGQQFKIVRGLKPTIFEIWKNNELINQDSHNKEYQKILEQNILKLNHKSFHQVVVLGSSSFIPFMQLPSHIRREVIEDILDINVFSKMNTILKEQTAKLKDNILNNSHDLEIVQTKIDAQKKHICELEKISESAKREKETELKEQQAELARLESEFEGIQTEILDELNVNLNKLGKKKMEFEKYQFQFEQKIKKFDKDILFYEENDTCPTCDQEITELTKENKVTESKDKKQEIINASNDLTTQLQTLQVSIDEVQTKYLEENNRIDDAKMVQEKISWAKKRVNSLQSDVSELSTGMDSMSTARDTLESLRNTKEIHTTERLKLAEEREYNSVITTLLKDTGIKTKIIKQYLPVINKLTNQYLQILDFYVHFDLDESFKETIRSRHRDAFSYDSFSEGEKQRIDLALLFTWRQIAKMKNSVATNLLILDETFDSSLDADGVENLMKILDTLDNTTNVFVISHKGELLDNKFDRKIEFVKAKNFSKVA